MSSLVQAKCTSSPTSCSARPGRRVREPLLEEVLDRLDVVHRDALDLGQLGRPRRSEGRDDVAEVGDVVVGQRGRTRDDAVGGQVDQPLDLDVHALAVERGLAQVVDERRDRGAVAAVQRTERDRRRDVGEPDAGVGEVMAPSSQSRRRGPRDRRAGRATPTRSRSIDLDARVRGHTDAARRRSLSSLCPTPAAAPVRRARSQVTPARRPGPVLLVGALVAVAVLMAALAGPWQLGHRSMPDADAPVITLAAADAQAPQPSGDAVAAARPAVARSAGSSSCSSLALGAGRGARPRVRCSGRLAQRLTRSAGAAGTSTRPTRHRARG